MEIDHSRCQRFKFQKRFNRVNRAINTRTSRPIKCWHCGQEGHISRDYRTKEQQSRLPMGHGSKQISNDQELIQSYPISCPQNPKGNNYIHKVKR